MVSDDVRQQNIELTMEILDRAISNGARLGFREDVDGFWTGDVMWDTGTGGCMVTAYHQRRDEMLRLLAVFVLTRAPRALVP